MSFLRRLIPGLDDDSDEEGEGEALLEHEDYSSSESESSGSRDDTLQLEIGGEALGDNPSDHEAAISVDEDSNNGRDTKVQGQAQGESSSSGGSRSGKKQKNQKKKFDISLPAQHLYLGELEQEGVANLEDDETTPTLPLLCVPNRVLFPEETLPMHIYNPHVIQVLRDAITRKKPVAIATDLRLRVRYGQHLTRRPTKDELAEYGTTAEVVGLREEEQSDWYYAPFLVVKFHGKQRFRLLEVYRRVNGTMDARIEILPERLLPNRPYELFTCPPHVYDSCHATQLLARQPDCSESTIRRLEVCRKRLRSPQLSTSLCSVPSWVFTFYETDYLREILMREQQLKTFVQEKVSALPEDIQSLSYWLARRLPIDDQSKLELLSFHCPTQRLIRGLQILKEFTDLSCQNCDAVITKKEHVFSMSVDGPLASYVNPGGFVHDTLTVMKADHLKKQGSPSTEHSWFPGYKWTIMDCKRCGQHKGWLFEATKKKMEPDKFYGLRRPGLQLKTSSSPEVSHL